MFRTMLIESDSERVKRNVTRCLSYDCCQRNMRILTLEFAIEMNMARIPFRSPPALVLRFTFGIV